MKKKNPELFYNGGKLLNMKDLYGLDPLLYFCVGNRTAGKSFFFKRYLVRYALKHTGRKFLLFYRKVNQLKGCTKAFFQDLQELEEFKSWDIKEKKLLDGKIVEISLISPTLEEFQVGYAISLKYTEEIKQNSSLFVGVDRVLFDEFQSESGDYLSNELGNFQNILTSILRGGGKHIREGVKVFMVSNKVSIVNPYFLAFDISKRLKNDTKFLRGKGWVLEMCYIEAAAREIQKSALGRLFEGSEYIQYSTGSGYLLDDKAYIQQQPRSYYEYMATLLYNQEVYSLLYFPREGLYYIKEGGERGASTVFSLDLSSHGDSFSSVLITKSQYIKGLMRYFENHKLIFESLQAKAMMFDYFKYKA